MPYPLEGETTMHPIHLDKIHVPQGPNLWLLSRVSVVFFLISLALFGSFSLMGGSGFGESMGGTAGLWFLLGGLFVSVVFAFLERDESGKDS